MSLSFADENHIVQDIAYPHHLTTGPCGKLPNMTTVNSYFERGKLNKNIAANKKEGIETRSFHTNANTISGYRLRRPSDQSTTIFYCYAAAQKCTETDAIFVFEHRPKVDHFTQNPYISIQYNNPEERLKVILTIYATQDYKGTWVMPYYARTESKFGHRLSVKFTTVDNLGHEIDDMAVVNGHDQFEITKEQSWLHSEKQMHYLFRYKSRFTCPF